MLENGRSHISVGFAVLVILELKKNGAKAQDFSSSVKFITVKCKLNSSPLISVHGEVSCLSKGKNRCEKLASLTRKRSGQIIILNEKNYDIVCEKCDMLN